MTTPLLEARHLQKAYRKRRVVHDVSLHVNAGEIVGLLGPNGAGKTTSFNMVVGLLKPDRGDVLFQGESLVDMPLHQRARTGLGYLAQESTIFRGLSVEANFLAVLESHPLSQAARKRRCNDLLAQYNLEHVRHNLGSQLSGGERRRVEMARCLAHAPKVVLLDEPFAGVDPIAVAEIRRFVQALRDDGLGVLITDHNVRETLKLCDRAYVISQGHILLSGSPEHIVADPLARATYLGEDFEL